MSRIATKTSIIAAFCSGLWSRLHQEFWMSVVCRRFICYVFSGFFWGGHLCLMQTHTTKALRPCSVKRVQRHFRMPRMESHRKRSNKDSSKSNTPLRNLPNHINRRVACRCTNCNVPFSQMSWEKNARQEQISASGGMAPWGLHQAGCFSLHNLRIYMVSLNPPAKLQADSHRFDGQTGFNHRNFHPSFIFCWLSMHFQTTCHFPRLLECCRAGDSVDSPIFSAAGLDTSSAKIGSMGKRYIWRWLIWWPFEAGESWGTGECIWYFSWKSTKERIQFHFYPKGYDGTSVDSICWVQDF